MFVWRIFQSFFDWYKFFKDKSLSNVCSQNIAADWEMQTFCENSCTFVFGIAKNSLTYAYQMIVRLKRKLNDKVDDSILLLDLCI